MSEIETPIDANIRACRACMSTKAESFHSLYSDDLLEKFQYCIDVKITQQAVSPQLVCNFCALEITNFADFKQKCIKSDAFWKDLSLKSSDQSKTKSISNINDDYVKDELNITNDSLDCDDPTDNTDEVLIEIKNIKPSDVESEAKPKDKVKSKKRKFKPLKNEAATFESVGKRMLKKSAGQCRRCAKTFSYKKNFINHLEQCGSKTPITKCNNKDNIKVENSYTKDKYCGICDKTTESFEEMKLHLHEHALSVDRDCRQCDFKALDLAELFAHRYQHQPSKLTMFLCHKCDKRFLMPARFEHHYRGVHLGLTPGICRLCNNTYQNYKKWRHHLRTHSCQFECDYCHKKFAMKYDLRAHINSYHLYSNIKSMVCDVCGFTTKRLSNLKLHISIRHVEHKPQCCHECGKVFKDEYSLRSHMKRMHSKVTVACPVCGKPYPSQAALKHHLIWHSDERPYKCELCDRRYKAKSTLREHLHSHRGGKPFECETCLKHFSSSLLLSRHKKRHLKAAAKAATPLSGKNAADIGGSYFA